MTSKITLTGNPLHIFHPIPYQNPQDYKKKNNKNLKIKI